jgi:hypothetical protein
MVKKMLATVAGAVIAAYLAALVIPFDPQDRQPGTRLSGELVTSAPSDWSFVEDRREIYVQTSTRYGIPHSVTTIAFTVDGDLYVPCGNCESKIWPRNVARNPNVRVQIDNKLYDRVAKKVTDPATLHAVFDGRHLDMPGLALYRMDAPQ